MWVFNKFWEKYHAIGGKWIRKVLKNEEGVHLKGLGAGNINAELRCAMDEKTWFPICREFDSMIGDQAWKDIRDMQWEPLDAQLSGLDLGVINDLQEN